MNKILRRFDVLGTALFLSIFLYLTAPLPAFATDEIYVKTFGNRSDPAVIYLHGGPGHNCYLFEAAAAETLAGKGLFVVAYDQRGCARSKTVSAKYSFDEASDDLKNIFDKFNIKNACLIGHSFGGAVAVKFAGKYPKMVRSIVFTGAPFDYPAMFRTIIKNCRAVYEKRAAAENLAYIGALEKSAPDSAEYAGYCFMHAIACGLYYPKAPSSEAVELMKKISAGKNFDLVSKSEQEPFRGFFANERYTSLNLLKNVSELPAAIGIYAIYGEDDGLFDEKSLGEIKKAVGEPRFVLQKTPLIMHSATGVRNFEIGRAHV